MVSSQHFRDKVVNILFSVSPISTSLERMTLGSESTSRSSQFEGPQKVVCFLKVRSDSMNFINKIFDSGNTLLSKSLINYGIVGKRNSLLFNFTITSFEYKFSDSFSWRISKSNIWFYSSKEISWGFVDSNKYTIVNLS